MNEKLILAVVFLRLHQVEAATGLKKSSIYAKMATDDFPGSYQLLGPRSVGWKSNEIQEWIDTRPRAKQEAA